MPLCHKHHAAPSSPACLARPTLHRRARRKIALHCRALRPLEKTLKKAASGMQARPRSRKRQDMTINKLGEAAATRVT